MTNGVVRSGSSAVLLTNPIHPRWQAYLADRYQVLIPESQESASLMAYADAANYVVVRAPLPVEFLEKATKLKAAIRHGSGLDMIPMEVANANKIAVANAPGANATTVAEYVVGQLINLSRHLVRVHNELNDEGWNSARALSSSARELKGKCIVIVGVGAIGPAIAKICYTGFGMQVIGVTQSSRRYADFVEYRSLQEALGLADYIVLSCPLNESTVGLIDHQALKLMKAGVRIVNVSRGAVINEQALVSALEQGQVAGAALDVFHVQPLPENSPLRSMPQVVLSPHVAGITGESMEIMSEMVVRQIESMENGELPQYLVNKDCGEAILKRWKSIDDTIKNV